MDDRDLETQTFDTQSVLPSSPVPDHMRKSWIRDEYQTPGLIGDTVVLRSSSEETPLQNVDGDAEVQDIPDYVKDTESQMVDDYEEEVVLDSDDELAHKTEMVSIKELSSGAPQRTAGGDVLDTSCVQYKDFVLGSTASARKQCHIGYVRRGAGSASHRPNPIHSDACSQKQLVIKDNETPRPEDQFSGEKKVSEAVKDRDNLESNVNIGKFKDDPRSGDVLGKISTRNTFGGCKLSETKCDSSGCENDCTLLISEHDTEELRHNESQEPGELSQANALDVVDHYLSFNNMNLSEESAPTKTSRQKSPPILCAKGPQIMARRARFRMPGTFEWVDNQIDDEEGDLLIKRKDLNLHGEGPEPASVTRHLSAIDLNVQRRRNLDIQHKEKFQGEDMGVDFSNSSFIGLNSEEVDQVSEMQFAEEIDEQLNSESGQELEARDVEPDIFDVGFDTQMAAEAMEALFYAPLPNSNLDSSHQYPDKMVEDSSIGAAEKCSFSTRDHSNSRVAARKLKQSKRPSKKLSGKTFSSSRKNKKSQNELNPEIPKANKMKRGKSLAENHITFEKLTNAQEHSRQSSFKLNGQGKEDKILGRDNIKKGTKNLISSVAVKHNSIEEGPSEGKHRTFAPITHETRSSPSVCPLKGIEDPIKSSGKRMSDVMEASDLKKRNNNSQNDDMHQVPIVRRKRLKIGLHISEEAAGVKVSQQAEKELGVAPPGSHLKLDAWSYPKGKRKNRNLPHHLKGLSDICLPSTLANGEKGNGYAIESHKKSPGNSERSCFNVYVRRKPRSSAYACQVRSSLVKNCDESLLRQSSDNRSSADVCSGSFVMNRKMTALDPDRVQAYRKSEEPDHADFTSPTDGVNGNIKLDILSRRNAKASFPKCPSPVNNTKGLDLVPAIHKDDQNCKQMHNRNLFRFPRMKELISLGFSGSLTEITSKDLRRRRDMAHVRVVFSQNLEDDIIKQQKKILARLGSSIASCCSDATHFIADRFVRTKNMLEAIALGKPVVTHLWIDSCGQASCYIDEKNCILRDAKKEKEIGFSMPVSLAQARQNPLLKGRRVFVTPNVKPGKELIESLVKAAHGQAVDRIQEAVMKNKIFLGDVLIISSEQDYALCTPFLDKGAAVYSSELLLNGIIIQKLEFERHQLFEHHLKGNGSRTGPKKHGDWSLPVPIRK
ncbi:PAX-interacting protein [Actinidia chinensis var. chinensis]|uniref:PAX-interacting protein n=1 Tax=Actinidia chinensis var. chinensis TaxID=1590841 RepID=A0A2R6PNZ4_ACTCC|nr:PAX-interacting protein [Actinidia chinensis var. chinensis]